jgi:hypothetical protein
MRTIIHKYLLKNGAIRYQCNQACTTNWKKTNITNKKITCKNCKRAIAKAKASQKYLAKLKKEQKKLLEMKK